MKKICFAVCVLVCFAFCINVSAEEVVPTNSTIVINGEVAQFSVPTVAVQGRTMVPMREIFEKLGATVEWINDEQRIIAKTATKTIDMQINNNWTICNNIEIYTDAAPMLYNGRTVVPLRFVGEQLNLNVGWDGNTNTITLDTKGVVTIGTVQKEEVEFHEDYDMSYEVRILKKYTGELVDGVPSGVGSMDYYYYDEKGNINPYYSYKHVGCFSDGKENGFISQVMSFEQYEKYSFYVVPYEELYDYGYYTNGERNGFNSFVDGSSGRTYAGVYVNGVMDETDCTIIYPNGDRYEGEISAGYDDNGVLHMWEALGFGRMHYGENMCHMGNWNYGVPEGYGQVYEEDRLLRDGNFKNGVMEGFGIVYDKMTGKKALEGEFKNDMLNGFGMLYSSKTGNLIYQGGFVDNVPNGYGKQYNEYGNIIYDGNFVDGKYNGYGKAYDDNGVLIYEGIFPYEAPQIVYVVPEVIYDVPAGGYYSGTVVESKIDGNFEGFEYENIYKLTNGQIWMQTSYDHEYHYAYRPDVIIFKDGINYKMKVEGAKKLIKVERIK